MPKKKGATKAVKAAVLKPVNAKADTVTLRGAVAGAFGAAQKTVSCHGKHCLTLSRERKAAPEAFRAEFLRCLGGVLVVFKREPAVERLVTFVARFCASEGDVDGAFALGLLEHLVAHAHASEKAVRLRCCQLVGLILQAMAETLEIDDELWGEIRDAMLPACADKVPAVRSAAAVAVSYFQDPADAECTVMGALVRMMGTDSSKDVRRTAMAVVALNSATVPAMLRRLRDDKEDVRKAVLSLVAEKLPVTKLSVAQRCEIVAHGLGDRDKAVNDACAKLLSAKWLHGQLDGDIMTLAAMLDVEENEELAAKAITCVFEKGAAFAPTGAPTTQSWDAAASSAVSDAAAGDSDGFSAGLAPEVALYMRVRAEYLKGMRPPREDLLDTLLPGLTTLSELIAYHYQQIRGDDDDEDSPEQAPEESHCGWTMRQLLLCARYADMGDEAGRRSFIALLRSMLTDFTTTDKLVDAVLTGARCAMSDELSFVNWVCSVIHDLQPNHGSLALASLEVAQEKLDAAVQAREAAEASENIDAAADAGMEEASIRETIAQIEGEVAVDEDAAGNAWIRCLQLASNTLATSRLNLKRSGELEGLLRSLIVPAFTNADEIVRNKALFALGQFALLDAETARGQLFLAMQVLKNDTEEIQLTAMKVLFDFLLAFDFATATAVEQEGEETTSAQNTVLATILPYLGSGNPDLRTTAAEGIVKLFLADRINDPQFISRLAVLYCNPNTEDDQTLRQCLSVFFPAFAMGSATHRLCIESAFLPTLRICTHAPKNSPLSAIKLDELGCFLLQLTDASNAAPGDKDRGESVEMAAGIHERLGVAMLNEIFSDPSAAESRVYCKLLTMLSIDTKEQEGIKVLRALAANIADKIANRNAKTSMKKFLERLSAAEDDSAVELSEEKQQELMAATAQHVASKDEAVAVALAAEPAVETKLNATKSKAAKSKAKKGRKGKKAAVVEEEFEEEEEEEEFAEEETNSTCELCDLAFYTASGKTICIDCRSADLNAKCTSCSLAFFTASGKSKCADCR